MEVERIESLARELELGCDNIVADVCPHARELWAELLELHPADIALVLENIRDDKMVLLFEKLGKDLYVQVFDKLSVHMQSFLLDYFDHDELIEIFKKLPSDRLTTILEQIPVQHLGKYLRLTHKKRRQKLEASLSYEDKTAGRLLNSDVLPLRADLTVQKVASLLQEISPNHEILPRQYVVDGESRLLGYIEISDLLRHNPTTRLAKMMRPVEVLVNVHDDQEVVAEIVKRYDLLSVPVVEDKGVFLGVISANDVLEVLQEEATEDSYKMSGLTAPDQNYARAGFAWIVFQRCKWLVPLLLFQSISTFIITHFELTLTKLGLIGFITMLIGTGGNAGNQSSMLVVRGLATGEINRKNRWTILWREVLIGLCIGLVLAVVSLARVYFSCQEASSVWIILLSLLIIVMTSIFLGTLIPMILDAFEIDPANSAAPFIATLMDIIGVTIYCLVAMFFLR